MSSLARGALHWLTPAAAAVADPAHGSIPPVAHSVVVIQDDTLNASRITTTVVCALTSNLTRATEPGNVLLDSGEGALTKRSVVVVSQVSSVLKTDLGERIGALSEARVEQILAGMRFQQAAFLRGR